MTTLLHDNTVDNVYFREEGQTLIHVNQILNQTISKYFIDSNTVTIVLHWERPNDKQQRMGRQQKQGNRT